MLPQAMCYFDSANNHFKPQAQYCFMFIVILKGKLNTNKTVDNKIIKIFLKISSSICFDGLLRQTMHYLVNCCTKKTKKIFLYFLMLLDIFKNFITSVTLLFRAFCHKVNSFYIVPVI